VLLLILGRLKAVYVSDLHRTSQHYHAHVTPLGDALHTPSAAPLPRLSSSLKEIERLYDH